jgi:hypothetical protein
MRLREAACEHISPRLKQFVKGISEKHIAQKNGRKGAQVGSSRIWGKWAVKGRLISYGCGCYVMLCPRGLCPYAAFNAFGMAFPRPIWA